MWTRSPPRRQADRPSGPGTRPGRRRPRSRQQPRSVAHLQYRQPHAGGTDGRGAASNRRSAKPRSRSCCRCSRATCKPPAPTSMHCRGGGICSKHAGRGRHRPVHRLVPRLSPRLSRERARARSSSTGVSHSTGRRWAGRCWRSTTSRSRCASASSWRCWARRAAARARCSISSAVSCRSRPAESWSTAAPVTGPGPDRGIVFQHFALFPWKTVRKNVLYGLERQGLAARRAREPGAGLHRSRRPHRLRGQLPRRSSPAA